ncbi:MAG: tRNA (adenosine(37)-N6)-threonylcarbamoyltransferase complex transferase subunit TsaD [Pseudomonadota bacterium]
MSNPPASAPGDAGPALRVLGVEASCDDTAAAVVEADGLSGAGAALEGPGRILANVVLGQTALHAAFGGVVPEIAARAHVAKLDQAIAQACEAAGLGPPHEALATMDAVAVTAGPGLIGGVLAGVVTAKAVAAATGAPLLAINHLEGHALTPRLSDGLAYPYLLLLASGGHCQLIAVEGLGRYRRLGGTIDDAPGEAFDKLAKHLGLGFPGGPEVERWADEGDPHRFDLPRPLLNRPGADMSFSGLKTAARMAADALAVKQGGLYDEDVADLCASFQAAVTEALAAKTSTAARLFLNSEAARNALGPPRLAVAGGVAANKTLRAALERAAAAAGMTLAAPPLSLCTDNAAMIAWAGLERLAAAQAAGETLNDADAAIARPRWPLDGAAPPQLGAGRRGPKA